MSRPFRKCITPCQRFIMPDDSSVIWLGAEHVRSALESQASSQFGALSQASLATSPTPRPEPEAHSVASFDLAENMSLA